MKYIILKGRPLIISLATVFSMLLLSGCTGSSNNSDTDNFSGLKIKLLVGSALGHFCDQAAQKYNTTQPKLDNGTEFRVKCEAVGSGDVVTKLVEKATQLKNGTLQADAEDFPTVLSLDGDIYYSQLIYRMNQVFPGKNYIPEITDSSLVANTPMVFMAQADVATALRKAADPYKALVTAKTHRDIDPSGPPTVVHYVHAAPTRSNSGLQTLVAQYTSVSGKRPEELTLADVQKFQPQIQQIQSKITRYGVSTNSLAQAMVKNGSFWASVGSVYESSVIAANSGLQPGQTRYEAVYPKSTFTSNMRAILPNAPWVSADEKAGAEKFIAFMRSPDTQNIATNLGLRPGTPGVALGAKFTKEFGVDPQVKYDSLRPAKPEVVDAMLKSWQEYAKKPSLVVVVVDSSGSMSGNKLPAVQTTLQTYINNLGSKEQIALIDFDSEIRPPVLVDGTPQGKERGLQFVSGLKADGGTSLYDATLEGRNWLQTNLRKDAINAVLAGGISLIVGIRFIQLPSVIMLPLSAGIVVVGASYLKSREPESLELDNPELEREIQAVRSSALALVSQANELRLETKKLLTDSFQIDLLAAVQISCDRAIELPAKIDNLARTLKSNNALLSVDELQRQLAEVQQKQRSSSGIAKQHLSQLVESLKRNIQLAQEGQDTRLAQIVSLSTQIQDFAGVLQQLQTKLHTTDLTDAEQIAQLQALSDELGSLRENMYLLVSK